ncbi:MAG: hypothetical protein MI924_23610 [Chloroflexales bacterium]|nr:hypothetical protein [Chloroflexales bacterium]
MTDGAAATPDSLGMAFVVKYARAPTPPNSGFRCANRIVFDPQRLTHPVEQIELGCFYSATCFSTQQDADP